MRLSRLGVRIILFVRRSYYIICYAFVLYYLLRVRIILFVTRSYYVLCHAFLIVILVTRLYYIISYALVLYYKLRVSIILFVRRLTNSIIFDTFNAGRGIRYFKCSR